MFGLVLLLLRPSAPLLAGLVVSAGAQAGAVALFWGPEPLSGYTQVMRRLVTMPGAFEPKLWAMHNLRAGIELLTGPGLLATALWAASAGSVAWMAWTAWRAHGSADVRFAVASLAALLLNPHLYVYDLVLLAVPLGIVAATTIADWPARSTVNARLLYALPWLLLAAPLARYTHLQLTTPVLVAMLWNLSRERR
jgi:hypothetical protein